MMKINILYKLMIIMSFLYLVGCKKSSSEAEETAIDQISNTVETSLSEASSISTSLSSDTISSRSYSPQAVCSISNVRSSCQSSTKTIDFNNCTIGSGDSQISVNGAITETWSGTGHTFCRMLGDQATLTRVIDSSNPKVVTLASGATITTKVASETAFDDTTFDDAANGTIITRLQSGTSNSQSCGTTASTACFHVMINGLQKTKLGPKGKTWFNHIITADMTFVGDLSSTDKTLTGTSTVWHQVAAYKAVHTFNNVKWNLADDCRFPTSGSISTVLTGAVEGNVTTTFSGTCGEATFSNTDGSESTVNLSLSE